MTLEHLNRYHREQELRKKAEEQLADAVQVRDRALEELFRLRQESGAPAEPGSEAEVRRGRAVAAAVAQAVADPTAEGASVLAQTAAATVQLPLTEFAVPEVRASLGEDRAWALMNTEFQVGGLETWLDRPEAYRVLRLRYGLTGAEARGLMNAAKQDACERAAKEEEELAAAASEEFEGVAVR